MGRQVHNNPAVIRDFQIQRIAPEIVEIGMPVHGRLRLHSRPIGHHAVQGLEDAIEPGENTQMLL